MRKLPARHAPKLFAFFMSCFMGVIMTFFITYINTGWDRQFVWRWLHAFMVAWPIAFVCVLLLAGQVRKLVANLTTS